MGVQKIDLAGSGYQLSIVLIFVGSILGVCVCVLGGGESYSDSVGGYSDSVEIGKHRWQNYFVLIG
jgi:hypothetical protein